MKPCLALLIAAIARAQPAELPKFETASVKRTECREIHNSLSPATVVLRGDPLKIVLTEAFQLKRYQIAGPAWLDEDCFEIVARPPEGAGIAQIPAMLQSLLAERFHLVAHMDERPAPAYALVVDKGGPKFKEAPPPTMNYRRGGPASGLVFFRSAANAQGFKGSLSMATVAKYLAGHLDRPVFDLTGLSGTFDIDLTWAPDPAIDRLPPYVEATRQAGQPILAPDPPAATLFTALRESLGLRLEARNLPVQSLVIDRIDRTPTGN
jgi:uncharacterized protein (TIGR03435 family)